MLVIFMKRIKKDFLFCENWGKEIDTEDELVKCIPKSLNEISWKK